MSCQWLDISQIAGVPMSLPKFATELEGPGRLVFSSKRPNLTRKSGQLPGGFNPFEKYESIWIISPSFGVKMQKNIWNHNLEFVAWMFGHFQPLPITSKIWKPSSHWDSQPTSSTSEFWTLNVPKQLSARQKKNCATWAKASSRMLRPTLTKCPRARHPFFLRVFLGA